MANRVANRAAGPAADHAAGAGPGRSGITRRLRVIGRLATLALAALPLAALPLAARADTVLVAVASNFAGPLAALAPLFQRATGHQLQAAAGATTRLATQIAAGAPYQVLLAADQATPARLQAEGLALAGSGFTYASGRLVLWSAQPGLVDSQGEVLARGGFKHLAIANPKLAPYGEAALAVLRARGLDATLRPRLVLAESVAQAYQFVLTGNAELGFVALSQVQLPGQMPAGSLWRVPAALHPAIHQDAVLLKPGQGQVAAQALLDFLKSPAAKALIQAYGFGV